ncbi:acyl-CoA dehydrogenase family protein [Salipaludibacillus aurantiacus]|uniref:Acyl-CoA dehydrogenase n=1 Tax=Salipaludibacillus aurantiacus TaxID=1601833 RepID=A0A1H9SIB4_9BACI|nr:acyl-CoA dehydrogenase family protein [Salipaludibacillus aurantiacus]SER84385.1 Acyl-CoA dehydrogenase [Salipaludibacillus aurantiacus]
MAEFMTKKLIKNDRQLKFLKRAEALVPGFQKRRDTYDKKAEFPFENMKELITSGLAAITVPEMFGGEEASLYEFLLVQETLAQGDAATALSIGWHNGTIMQLRDTQKWQKTDFEKVCRETVENGILINSAASEKATGSPVRGGVPETSAVLRDGAWEIKGHKTFTSLAPALDYFIITAYIEEEGRTGEFLIPRDVSGVSLKETWDVLGMRATRSDDLILDNVQLEKEALKSVKEPGHGKSPQGWLLHIPACYLGIAIAARDEAVEFAKNYQPNSLNHAISEVPEVRRKTAEMDLELMKARHFMYHIAEIWDHYPSLRGEMGAELASVKTVCTNAAIKVVDLSMRIAGGHSLHRSSSFEQHYRDVRAGLHNPPSDDITMMILANQAFNARL